MQLDLGTVQLGLSYGIANKKGQPSIEETNLILNTALNNNINVFDTARAYGESENRIGIFLTENRIPRANIHLNTKLPPLNLQENSTLLEKKTIESIQQSLEFLQTSYIDCFLLHRWENQKNTAIWTTLQEYHRKHVLKKLGTSVLTLEEAIEALQNPMIQFIQLPCNLFDRRWDNQKFLDLRKQRPDVHIQARSTLLQGLFLTSPEKFPILSVSEATSVVDALHKIQKEFNRENIQDLAYSYVRSLPWVSSIVVGVETKKQLLNNIELFKTPLLSLEEKIIIQKIFGNIPEKLLCPSLW